MALQRFKLRFDSHRAHWGYVGSKTDRVAICAGRELLQRIRAAKALANRLKPRQQD